MNLDTRHHLDNKWNKLIFKFLSGKTTLAEDQELKKWIDDDPKNSELFDFLRSIWLSNFSKTGPVFYNTSKAWKNIKKSIDQPEKEEINFHSFISGRGISYFLKIAAFVIFIFVAGFVCSRLFVDNNIIPEQKYIVVTTPLGSKTHLMLPDSTEIWLNAGSTLSYLENNEEYQRNVSLTGEAFFKVKTDKSRPFVVKTRQVDVIALGTSFNVKAYNEDTLIKAVLLEGNIEVDIKGNHNKLSYTLEPNQIITIPIQMEIASESKDQNNIVENTIMADLNIQPIIEKIDNKVALAMTSWKDERWNIEGESLDMLAIMLERRYNIKINIVSGLLNNYKFSGTIKNETFEQVMQYLRYTTPLKYEVGKGEVWWDLDIELAKEYSKILDKNYLQ